MLLVDCERAATRRWSSLVHIMAKTKTNSCKNRFDRCWELNAQLFIYYYYFFLNPTVKSGIYLLNLIHYGQLRWLEKPWINGHLNVIDWNDTSFQTGIYLIDSILIDYTNYGRAEVIVLLVFSPAWKGLKRSLRGLEPLNSYWPSYSFVFGR